jgi:hypothetical protein
MTEPNINTLPLQSLTITRGVVPAVSFADVLEDLGKHDGLSRLGNTQQLRADSPLGYFKDVGGEDNTWSRPPVLGPAAARHTISAF